MKKKTMPCEIHDSTMAEIRDRIKGIERKDDEFRKEYRHDMTEIKIAVGIIQSKTEEIYKNQKEQEVELKNHEKRIGDAENQINMNIKVDSDHDNKIAENKEAAKKANLLWDFFITQGWLAKIIFAIGGGGAVYALTQVE